jgi:hypothetical protein
MNYYSPSIIFAIITKITKFEILLQNLLLKQGRILFYIVIILIVLLNTYNVEI